VWCNPYNLDDLNDDPVEHALEHLDARQRTIVHDHLATLLAAPLSHRRLQREWRRSGANFNFGREADLRAVMADIIRRIDLMLDKQ
jgi:hypothetical protein